MYMMRPKSTELGAFKSCISYVVQQLQPRCFLHNTPHGAANVSYQFVNKHTPTSRLAAAASAGHPQPHPSMGTISVPALNTVASSRLSADRTRMMPFNRNANTANHYQLLGVRPDASSKDIKAAYYLLAKLYHPDAKNKKDSVARKKFLEISEAYEVLSDDARRADYNKRGMAKQKQSLMGRTPERTDTFTQKTEASKSTIITDLTLELPFLDAICGTEKQMHIPIAMPCRSCKTSGGSNGCKTQPTSTPVLCQFCKGSGFNVKVSGSNRMDVRCKMCKGTRYTYKCMCPECGDRGTVMVDEPVTVHVPAGTADNDVLKATHPQTGRPMKVNVRIVNNEQFRRKGHDVFSSVLIPFTLAILGGPLTVPSVYGGETHIKIPAGTQTDTHIRLVGKGIKKDQLQGHGDHILVVKIRIPQHLTERQKTLVASFSTMENATLDASTRQQCGRPMTEASLMAKKSVSRLIDRHSMSAASLLK